MIWHNFTFLAAFLNYKNFLHFITFICMSLGFFYKNIHQGYFFKNYIFNIFLYSETFKPIHLHVLHYFLFGNIFIIYRLVCFLIQKYSSINGVINLSNKRKNQFILETSVVTSPQLQTTISDESLTEMGEDGFFGGFRGN